MNEFVTEAIVLGSYTRGEYDKYAVLFTYTFGKIEARVVSGSKPQSKLFPHLDTLNHVTVRLARKTHFVVTDALTCNRFTNLRTNSRKLHSALIGASLLRTLLPPLLPDTELWQYLLQKLEGGGLTPFHILSMLGYDPTLASCVLCKKSNADAFLTTEEGFLCGQCAARVPDTPHLIYLSPLTTITTP